MTNQTDQTNQPKENKRKGFIPFVTRTGEKIANLFLMQLFFILYSIKGAIVLGVFPSIAAMTRTFIDWFILEDAIQIHPTFKDNWSKHFKKANLVGYTLLLAFGFLYFDLRINEQFIQSPALHTLLLVILFILGFLTVYAFPILVGHALSYKDIFKQSFFVALSTPLSTIAAVLGVVLAFELSRHVIFIGLFFGMPLIILPLTWFPYNGLKKIEELKDEFQKEEEDKQKKKEKKLKSDDV